MYSMFFFKQKTAYELRISDWSSDVCSSDLGCESSVFGACRRSRGWSRSCKNGGGRANHGFPNSCASAAKPTTTAPLPTLTMPVRLITLSNISMLFAPQASRRVRSEEHTSELQSLMRISYAVFCLKTKNKQT